MKRILLLTLALFAVHTLRAQYNIPPVGEAKIVAEYCLHCGLINFEKGETHRSDCPYQGDGSTSESERSYGSGRETYENRHYDAWYERKAAREARKAELEAKKTARALQRYAREKKVKLKDYVPMAGQTVVAPMGATENTQVIAKYDRKGVPRYGLKNKASGKWIRKPQFEGITIVGPHAAAASLKGKTAIIDPDTGQPTTEYAFDQFKAFHYPDNAKNTILALAKTTPESQRTWYMMKADGNGNYGQFMVCQSTDFYEDATGRKVIYREADNHKVGIMDEFGNDILPPIFDGLMNLEFAVNDASYYQARIVNEDGQSVRGVIDDKGRVVVPCRYDSVDAKSWGKYGIKVEKEGKVGVFDVEGNQLLPDAFDSLELDHFWKDDRHWAFFRGWVTDGDGKRYCALFNTEGEQLTSFSDSIRPYYDLEDMTDRLEEYRIY